MTKIKSVSMTIIYFESGFQINAELSFYIISIDITIMRFIIVSKFWLSYIAKIHSLFGHVLILNPATCYCSCLPLEAENL